jgi:hypothetical protein
MAPLRRRTMIERLAMLCALAVPLTGPAWGACVDIKSPDLSFAGTLGFRIFPGPPNFADVRKGDTPEPAYLLKLDQPICASGDAALASEGSFDQIELLPDHSGAGRQLSATLRHLLGQRVSVAGKSALAASTAHRHAPLMLAITAVSVGADVAVRDGTAMTTVQGFYLALRAGDGDEAAKFIVPDKRTAGPFSPTAITNYYGGLTDPVTLLDISSTQPNEYRVRYTFVPPGRPRCNATSLVRIAQVNGMNLIESIQALNTC